MSQCDQLEAYHSGELSHHERLLFSRHLLHCQRCSEIVAADQVLITNSDDITIAGDEHPASDILAAFALGEVPLDVHIRNTIQQHLTGCPSCAYEVSLARGDDDPLQDNQR